MKHGLEEKAVTQIQSVLAAFPAVEKAVLYGSRAKGNFKPGSDIDLALYGSGLSLQALHRIEDALDDLLLPYHIDLAIFARIANAELREHIQRVGVVFYERERSRSTEPMSSEAMPRT
ncbi:MAG: nucleotidyltransferase domain-containing protein [candidate division KSB1 bacterium]